MLTDILAADTSTSSGKLSFFDLAEKAAVDSLAPRDKALLIHSLHLRSCKSSGSFALPLEQVALDFWLIERLFLSTKGKDLTVLKLSLDGLALGDDLLAFPPPSSSSSLSSPLAGSLPLPKGVLNVHHDLLHLLQAFAQLPGSSSNSSSNSSSTTTLRHPTFAPSGEREREDASGRHHHYPPGSSSGLLSGKQRVERLLEHFRVEGIVALRQWNAERLEHEKRRVLRLLKAKELKERSGSGGNTDTAAAAPTTTVTVKPFWPVKLFADFDDTMAPKLFDYSFPSTSSSSSSSTSTGKDGSGSATSRLNPVAGAAPYPGVSAFIEALTGGGASQSAAMNNGGDDAAKRVKTPAEEAIASEKPDAVLAGAAAIIASGSSPARLAQPAAAPGAVLRRKKLAAAEPADSSAASTATASAAGGAVAGAGGGVEETIQALSLAEFLAGGGGGGRSTPSEEGSVASSASASSASSSALSPQMATSALPPSALSNKRLPVSSLPPSSASVPGGTSGGLAVRPGVAAPVGPSSPLRPALRQQASAGDQDSDGAAATVTVAAANKIGPLLRIDPAFLSVTISPDDIRSVITTNGGEGSFEPESKGKDGNEVDNDAADDDDDATWRGHIGISGTVYLSARPSMLKSTTLQTVSSAVLNGRPPRAILCGSIMTSFSNAGLAKKKLENFLAYSRLYPEFRAVWVGDSGQGDVEAGRRMIEVYRVWQQEAQAEAGGVEGSNNKSSALLWWPPPPPLVLIHDIVTGSSSSSSSSSSGSSGSVGAPGGLTSEGGAGNSGGGAGGGGGGGGGGGSRLTPPLERARLRAQGINLFNSYLEAALLCFEGGAGVARRDDETGEGAAALTPAPLLSRKDLLWVLERTAEDLSRVKFSNDGQRRARLEEFTTAVKRVNLALEKDREGSSNEGKLK